MKAPHEGDNRWERVLSRYFHACNIPVQWEYQTRRFEGLSGFEIARINPKAGSEERVWQRMPESIRDFERRQTETHRELVILVTNRQYGDSVEDSIVVTRLGAYAPLLKAFLTSNPERNR